MIGKLAAPSTGKNRIPQLRERRVRGGVPVLEEISHGDGPSRPKELPKPHVVIVVLVREDDRVHGAAGDPEPIEQPSEARHVGATVDQYPAAAVLDENRVALPDVEHADDKCGIARRRPEHDRAGRAHGGRRW